MGLSLPFNRSGVREGVKGDPAIPQGPERPGEILPAVSLGAPCSGGPLEMGARSSHIPGPGSTDLVFGAFRLSEHLFFQTAAGTGKGQGLSQVRLKKLTASDSEPV